MCDETAWTLLGALFSVKARIAFGGSEGCLCCVGRDLRQQVASRHGCAPVIAGLRLALWGTAGRGPPGARPEAWDHVVPWKWLSVACSPLMEFSTAGECLAAQCRGLCPPAPDLALEPMQVHWPAQEQHFQNSEKFRL